MPTILIVEDDQDLHQNYRVQFEPEGYELTIVTTGEQALELVDAQPFDCAIINLMLPGIDGAELARRLRDNPDTEQMPIVVLTAMGEYIGIGFDESDQAWLPADKILDKSNDNVSLFETVETLLTEHGGRTPAGKRDGKQLKHIYTTCPYCGAGCGMYLKARRGRIGGVDAAPNHPVSRGRLCDRGWTSFQPAMHPERIKQPMMRRDGRLEPVSWEEALTACTEALGRINERYGPDALGVISSARCTNEENYLAQKFARAALGTNNIDHCARTCHSPTVAGPVRSFGGMAMTNSIEEIADAACILIVGCNVTQVSPLVGWRVRRARDKGARLIVADHRYTEAADWADVHLAHRPGTDVALLNALASAIVDEGLEDRSYIAAHTDNFDQYVTSMQDYSPEQAAELCGVDAEAIRQAARLYAETKPASIVCALSVTDSTVGTDELTPIVNLAALTGNIGFPSSGVAPLGGHGNLQGACDMGALPNYYPGYQPVDDPAVRARFEEAWGVPLPSGRGRTAPAMLEAAGAGEIRGLYVIGADPACSEPSVGALQAHLRELDFLVSQELFVNDTCRLADVVLPAAGFAEKDGTFTSAERRVQRIRQAMEPIGMARPDWEILCDISRRMGLNISFDHPSEIMDEIASLTPIYAGISYQRLEKGGLQWPCLHARHEGTPHLPAGKHEFRLVEYEPPADTPDSEYPLVLNTGRMLFHSNVLSVLRTMSRRMDLASRESPANQLMMNPTDAARFGIRSGQRVRVTVRGGSVVATAELAERLRPGMIWMPVVFVNAPENGIKNNRFSLIAGTSEYKVCPARVEPMREDRRGR